MTSTSAEMEAKPSNHEIIALLSQIVAWHPEKLLSDKSVAEILNVSRDQVWRLTRAGELPKPRMMKAPCGGKGSTRWLHSEIVQYINSLPVAE